MNIFEDINHTTEKIIDIGEHYLNASHQYLKLKIFQQLALGITTIVKLFVVGIFLFASLVFISIAASIAIGVAFNSYPLGFLFVGGIYMFLTLIVFSLRSHLNSYIIKKINTKFFN